MKISSQIILFLLALLFAISTFAGTPDPAKLQDKVTLKLNDKVSVTFHAQGDKLNDPKVTSQTAEKPSTVSFSYTLEQGTRMLTIQNAFARGVRMRCLVRVAGSKKFVESTIHPLFPNFFSTEAFDNPVEELVLFDFRLTDDKLPQ